MPRYALLIEYDGAPFHGWQRQAGGQPTVQATLEATLARLDPGPLVVQGSGRTDSGVHATGQVAHVDLTRAWEADRLTAALNFHLRPGPVAVARIACVADTFHARFDAIERQYLFRLLSRRAPPVLDRGRVWHVHAGLDGDAMRAGAAHLIGKHDFTTFRSAFCQAQSPVKTLDEIAIAEVPVDGGTEFRLRLRARSFLHNQVRSIVGSLERVGAGAWPPARMGEALMARDRAACGPVAPPEGLSLVRVRYPTDPFAPPSTPRGPDADPSA
jgi:tRNA pseudouridine38-40 synthase